MAVSRIARYLCGSCSITSASLGYDRRLFSIGSKKLYVRFPDELFPGYSFPGKSFSGKFLGKSFPERVLPYKTTSKTKDQNTVGPKEIYKQVRESVKSCACWRCEQEVRESVLRDCRV